MPGNAKPARAGGWKNTAPRKSFLLSKRNIFQSMREESIYLWCVRGKEWFCVLGFLPRCGHLRHILSATETQITAREIFLVCEKFSYKTRNKRAAADYPHDQWLIEWKEKHGRRKVQQNDLIDGTTFLLGTVWGLLFIIISNSAFPPVFADPNASVTPLIPFPHTPEKNAFNINCTQCCYWLINSEDCCSLRERKIKSQLWKHFSWL